MTYKSSMICPRSQPIWLMAYQTIGPTYLKIGMHIQLDPGINSVHVRTPGEGGAPDVAGPKKLDFCKLK